MTITEPSAPAMWLDQFVPPELAAEGRQLTDDIEAISEAVGPLLERVARFYTNLEQLERDMLAAVTEIVGPWGVDGVSDGLASLVDALSGRNAILVRLLRIGINPDEIISAKAGAQ